MSCMFESSYSKPKDTKVHLKVKDLFMSFCLMLILMSLTFLT